MTTARKTTTPAIIETQVKRAPAWYRRMVLGAYAARKGIQEVDCSAGGVPVFVHAPNERTSKLATALGGPSARRASVFSISKQSPGYELINSLYEAMIECEPDVSYVFCLSGHAPKKLTKTPFLVCVPMSEASQ